MSRSVLGMVLLFEIFASSAWGADITDEATVISWKPLVRKVDDVKQECWNENHSEIAATQDSRADSLVGQGVAASSPPQILYTIVKRCRQIPVVNEIIEGYDVTYRYNGKEGHTVMPNKPERKVKVGISALPN